MPMLERPISRAGWTRVRFDQIATQINDRVDKPAEAGVERYVGLEHLDPDSLRIRRWGDPSDVESTKLRFQPGDIIFGKRRVYQRKVAVADFEGICSAHAMVLRARPDAVLPAFLPFFDLFMERALSISVGSLSPTINWPALAAEEFLLPPTQEQTRLVESWLALDAAIQGYSDLVDALTVLRASTLNDHFLPRFKSGVPIKSLAQLKAGGTPSRSETEYWGGVFPWASAKDLKRRDLLSTEENLTYAGRQVAKIAPVGATLIVVRGMILAHSFPVGVCRVPMAFNQDLRALIAGPSVRSEYLTLWAEWMAPWFISRTAESSHGTKRLEGHVLDNSLIPNISFDLQDIIISLDRSMLSKLSDAEFRLSQLQVSKKQFLTELVVEA
jgi:hypothetical protein